jgi:hypothetical protein
VSWSGGCLEPHALERQGLTLENVRTTLKEFHDAIGDEGGADEAERQRARVMRLLLELGFKEEEAAPQPPPPADDAAQNGAAAENGDEEADPFNLDSIGEAADAARPPLPAEGEGGARPSTDGRAAADGMSAQPSGREENGDRDAQPTQVLLVPVIVGICRDRARPCAVGKAEHVERSL